MDFDWSNSRAVNEIQDSQQVPPHYMARYTNWRRSGSSKPNGLYPQTRQIKNSFGTKILVGPGLGPIPLLNRPYRKIFLHHRRLWLRKSGVFRRRRHTSGDTGGVHTQRRPRP
ncbi:hypothetical protein Leryth_004396 [Lithospermum erythrorhizon]|nr:hypothetical protein Leryth_004396 [Lithospermum erythrorhizon]